MKKAIGFILLAIAIFLGFYWWFDIEESGGSFSDLWLNFSGIFSGGISSVTSALGIGNLSASDISTYAANAGFSGDDLNTAVGIALAESSGNPNAVGDLTITPGGSIGLWQINLKAHPEYTADALKNPQTNANAAYAVYQEANSSFTPWSTFNSGAYAQYVPNSNGTNSSDSSDTVSSNVAPDTTDDSDDTDDEV